MKPPMKLVYNTRMLILKGVFKSRRSVLSGTSAPAHARVTRPSDRLSRGGAGNGAAGAAGPSASSRAARPGGF